MKRKLKIHFLIIAISLTSLLGGYMQSLSVPIYATDDWETLTSNEQLVDAFKVYCKSRNTVIDGSVLDAVTSFTTTTFNNICNTLGIDSTLLQAEIQRLYSGTGYKYAFSASGLSGFNRIFAEFLQNNDLAVGDTVDNKVLKSGRWFQDDDGNGCWVSITTSTSRYPAMSSFTAHGSVYRYTGEQLSDLTYSSGNPFLFYVNYNSTSYEFNVLRLDADNSVRVTGSLDNNIIYSSSFWRGYLCVIYSSANGNTYVGLRHYHYQTNANDGYTCLTLLSGATSQETDVTLNTFVNTTINNETVINEGDTIIYNNDGTPDSGGGGGGDDPDQGDDWDPSVPVIPPAGGGTGNNNTINWPDIDIPDFNLPDFSLGDITDKFPFSIPFDLVALLTVLDGEPIAPHIEGSIPLGDFYTWDLDFDFSQFDNFARIFRAFEFIGFCIGLIYFTVRIVKG